MFKTVRNVIAGAVALAALGAMPLPASAMSVEHLGPVVAAEAGADLGLQHVWWRRYYYRRPVYFYRHYYYHPYYGYRRFYHPWRHRYW